MPVSRDASPTCDNLPHALFTHSEQLRVPINIIEPANTCRLFVANKQVLGYVTCDTTELHTEHVHIVARSMPKTLSQAEVASPAQTVNESLRLHCLTLLLWPRYTEDFLYSLDELTVDQLTKIVEMQ